MKALIKLPSIKVKISGVFIYKYLEDFFIWNIVNIVDKGGQVLGGA